jgi:hypothetical protein
MEGNVSHGLWDIVEALDYSWSGLGIVTRKIDYLMFHITYPEELITY